MTDVRTRSTSKAPVGTTAVPQASIDTFRGASEFKNGSLVKLSPKRMGKEPK